MVVRAMADVVDMGGSAVMHATVKTQLTAETATEKKYIWKVPGEITIIRVLSPWDTVLRWRCTHVSTHRLLATVLSTAHLFSACT